MVRLFVTGATGYIGGDALYTISHAHPEYEVTCLVRNSDKGTQVAKEYSTIKLVYGDLDAVELIENESRKADIVLNCANADHEPATRAIIKGLQEGHDQSRPGFMIHTSGTGILLWGDEQAMVHGQFGESSDKVYDDLEHVGEVTSFPDQAPHRKTDKLVLAAGVDGRLKPAIVCPPTIYGQGRGPGKKRSHQVPELARTILERGHGVQVGAGKTFWGNVHVHDLSNLYLQLVELAAAGGSTSEWPGKPDIWGQHGYFFCENGEHVWGEVSQWVTTDAHKRGLITSDEVKSIDKDEANKCTRAGSMMWGANSRSRAKRARAALGWKPTAPSLKEEIPMTVEVEAKALGLQPGHAKIAAGDA